MFRIRKNYRMCNDKLSKLRILAIRRLGLKQENGSKRPELAPAYQPKLVESEDPNSNYFDPKVTSHKPFSLILPPPNITGNLHLGHALTATIQDVIVRWKRMQSIETVWIPGIDHAGIATQVVVEKRLWKENRQSRHDVGREHFQDLVWKWKEEKADVIENQLLRLGASLNWNKLVFTMDSAQSRAVTEAFCRLFESGLIYRADHLVNWSCILQSAISDIEVDHLEVDGPTRIPVPGYEHPVEFGHLTHIAYKFHNSDEEVVVATTRPETMLGDVAVAVNPRDDRYSRHIGRNLWHPFRQQTIPIICDDFVDPDFGTGAVKVTPAHDHVDFEVGRRHGLPVLQAIDEKGNLTSVCGEFAGLRRFDGRDIVLSRLEQSQLLRGRHRHRMIVPICSRSKDVVEFLVRPQWFIKCAEMAARAAGDVREGRLVLEPGHFQRTWFHWLDNARDWCISRQLWWGHRIPAYFCTPKDDTKRGLWVAACGETEALGKAARQLSTAVEDLTVRQDEDVLDTWFSSALLPFSAHGWPQQSDDFHKFYPLDLMETGHDILFFWVARMVMLGTELTGQLPFTKIFLHGIVCDAQGRKMSKSLGNVIAPEDVIAGATLESLKATSRAAFDSGVLSQQELSRAVEGQKRMFPEGIPECGVDALRFTLCSHNIKSHFINFDVHECHANKLFGNKIWQATKFANIWMLKVSQSKLRLEELRPLDRWILSRLALMLEITAEAMETSDLHVATGALKNFLYFEFCDVYLETTKRGLRAGDGAIGYCWTLNRCLDSALRRMSPFMPRLAQHLHKRLEPFPATMEQETAEPEDCSWRNEALEKQIDSMREVVVAIRRMKKLFGVVAKHKPEVAIVGDLSLYGDFVEAIEDLSACHKVNITSQADKALIKNAVCDRIGTNTLIYLTVPAELLKAFELDLPKLEAKKEKLIRELGKMNKMISGDNYRVKATPLAQQTHAKKVGTLEEKLARINYIQSLSKQ